MCILQYENPIRADATNQPVCYTVVLMWLLVVDNYRSIKVFCDKQSRFKVKNLCVNHLPQRKKTRIYCMR